MSRLDTFLQRLQAQRLLLNWAAAEIASREGLVLELGLGNGRTYDHLRELLPGRTIFVFDREARAHPASMPPADMLIIGEMRETLPQFAATHGRAAVLIHVDATTGQPEIDKMRLAWLPGAIAALAAPDAIVLSDAALSEPSLRAVATPPEIPAGRYFAYRRSG
jgi:hypothetical protein